MIDSVIDTDREFSLGLSRLFLTNVFCDRQGGLETRSYGSRGDRATDRPYIFSFYFVEAMSHQRLQCQGAEMRNYLVQRFVRLRAQNEIPRPQRFRTFPGR